MEARGIAPAGACATGSAARLLEVAMEIASSRSGSQTCPTAGGPWQPAGNFQQLVMAVSAKWVLGCCRVLQMVVWEVARVQLP